MITIIISGMSHRRIHHFTMDGVHRGWTRNIIKGGRARGYAGRPLVGPGQIPGAESGGWSPRSWSRMWNYSTIRLSLLFSFVRRLQREKRLFAFAKRLHSVTKVHFGDSFGKCVGNYICRCGLNRPAPDKTVLKTVAAISAIFLHWLFFTNDCKL